MSSADQPGLVTKAYRTVRPRFAGHGDAEMNSIGWAIFLGMLILIVPLLPFLAVLWAVGKLLDVLAAQRGADEGR